MSKRMSELLWQAGGYTKLDGSYSLHESHLQKFAELIVRECIDILPEKVKIDDIYDANILVKCGTAIKEHFGV